MNTRTLHAQRFDTHQDGSASLWSSSYFSPPPSTPILVHLFCSLRLFCYIHRTTEIIPLIFILDVLAPVSATQAPSQTISFNYSSPVFIRAGPDSITHSNNSILRCQASTEILTSRDPLFKNTTWKHVMHIAGLLVALVGFTGAIQAADDLPFRPRVSRQLSRRQFQQRPGGNQGAVKPPGTIVAPPQKGNGQNGGNKGQNGGNKGQNGGNNQIGGGNGQEQQSLTLSRNSLQRTPNGLKNADAGTDEALQ